MRLNGAELLVAALGRRRGTTVSPASRTLTDKDSVVLGDFSNTTGDHVFDGALRQGLSVQLEQSPFLSIIPEQQIHRTLQDDGQDSPMRS